MGRRGGREAAGQAFEREVLGRSPWPARGTSEGLERVTADALAGFARDYLAPSNTILAVVSDRPHAEVAALVSREWRAAGRGVAEAEAEPPESGEPCDPAFDAPPEESAQVWLLVGKPLKAEPGRAGALRAGNAWLSDRVAFTIREERGLAYSVGTGLDPDPQEGWFRVALGTRPENLEEATAAAREAVAAALAGGIDPEDFEASVSGGRGRVLMRRLPSDNRAFQAAIDELRGRSLGFSGRPRGTDPQVTADEALAALREALEPGSLRAVQGR
jgi:predicted Zn-dependent peptidase